MPNLWLLRAKSLLTIKYLLAIFPGKIMKQASSFSLCPIISVAPVKGFTNRTQKKFDEYLQKLKQYVHKNTVFSENQCDLCKCIDCPQDNTNNLHSKHNFFQMMNKNLSDFFKTGNSKKLKNVLFFPSNQRTSTRRSRNK